MTKTSQLSTNEPKNNNNNENNTKQPARTGTESGKWTLHGGFSAERGRGRMGGGGTGNKKQNW